MLAVVVLGACASAAQDPSAGASDPPPAVSPTAGATTEPATREPAADEPSGAPTDVAEAPGEQAAGCGDAEQVPLQGGEHLIGDQPPPVPYNSTPPTSGWHSSGAFEIAVQPPDEPLSEPAQVSVLEAGGVVVAYRDLPPEDYRALRRLVRRRFAGRVALTPYEALERGEVALTAWGILQRCDGVDLQTVRAFAEEHAAPRPHTH